MWASRGPDLTTAAQPEEFQLPITTCACAVSGTSVAVSLSVAIVPREPCPTHGNIQVVRPAQPEGMQAAACPLKADLLDAGGWASTERAASFSPSAT